MIKSCNTCSHFRPFKPLSQLVVRELGVEEQELMSQVVKIMQDERQVQDLEAEQLVELKRQGESQWRVQPQMTDYCGLKENESIYYVYQIKNSGGDCGDYTEKLSVVTKCDNCSHKSEPIGFHNDQIMIARYRELMQNAAALNEGGGDQGLSTYIHSIGLRKAFEAAQAYYAGKITYRQPEYLSYCKLDSDETDFVVCLKKNPFDNCEEWGEQIGEKKRHYRGNMGRSIIDDLEQYGYKNE